MTIEYRDPGAKPNSDGKRLTGLVTPFNEQAVIGNLDQLGFREQIAPGAFTKTLQERDQVLLFNHNADMPLARKSAGSLALAQTERGLMMSATLADTTYAKDLLANVRAGVVNGMSFGFEVVKDEWTDDEGRAANSATGTNRTIREVKLHEVSAVTFPAYEQTAGQLSARDSEDARRLVPGGEVAVIHIAAARHREPAEILDEIRMGIQFTRRGREIVSDINFRDKYNAADRKDAASKGQAMPDGSFPIKDAEDLQNAIKLAGLAKDSQAARVHIMARAKALGLQSQIPDNWNADGTLKEENSASTGLETRDTIDGDDPNAGFYNVWANGAIDSLKYVLDTGQLPENYMDTFKAICDFIEAGAAKQSPSVITDAADSGSDGAQSYDRSEDYDAWLESARIRMSYAAAHRSVLGDFNLEV